MRKQIPEVLSGGRKEAFHEGLCAESGSSGWRRRAQRGLCSVLSLRRRSTGSRVPPSGQCCVHAACLNVCYALSSTSTPGGRKEAFVGVRLGWSGSFRLVHNTVSLESAQTGAARVRRGCCAPAVGEAAQDQSPNQAQMSGQKWQRACKRLRHHHARRALYPATYRNEAQHALHDAWVSGMMSGWPDQCRGVQRLLQFASQ